MKNLLNILIAGSVTFLLSDCHKRTVPDTSVEKRVPAKPVKKNRTPIPKVIVVNDSIASKTFDGRLYYDLDGHRYWKNYTDGKYYLYNKRMNEDRDFKKPQ